MDFPEISNLITNMVDKTNQLVESIVSNIYDVYLKNEKENDTFHFPVNPIGSITLNRSKKYDTADIVDLGEIDLYDKGKKIKELGFNTLFPKEYDTYCRYTDIPKPTDAILKLEKWMEQESPLRLIITGFNFNDLVTISKIDEEERAGEKGDKYINLNFRTYRELKIERVTTSKTVNTQLLSNRTTQNATSKATHTAGEWIVVTASSLNVRSGPGETNSILGSIQKDQCYKIGRVEGNWADIYWGNHGGWICTDYVK